MSSAPRTAELCKLAANAYLATRLSFVNGLAEFCDAADVDTAALLVVTGHDPRTGSAYFTPGLGFGGSCLSKDLRGPAALTAKYNVDATSAFLGSVDRINQARRQHAVDMVMAHLEGRVHGRRVGVWGAAFKAGIDDVRDSPALEVAVSLSTAGAVVSLYDPQAMENARNEHPELRYAESPVDAGAGAEVLMHLPGWPEFADIDPRQLSPAPDPLLVDARPGLNHEL